MEFMQYMENKKECAIHKYRFDKNGLVLIGRWKFEFVNKRE